MALEDIVSLWSSSCEKGLVWNHEMMAVRVTPSYASCIFLSWGSLRQILHVSIQGSTWKEAEIHQQKPVLRSTAKARGHCYITVVLTSEIRVFFCVNMVVSDEEGGCAWWACIVWVGRGGDTTQNESYAKKTLIWAESVTTAAHLPINHVGFNHTCHLAAPPCTTVSPRRNCFPCLLPLSLSHLCSII
jgi:hypothetical protein